MPKKLTRLSKLGSSVLAGAGALALALVAACEAGDKDGEKKELRYAVGDKVAPEEVRGREAANGKEASLADAKGKVVLLNFFAFG